MKVHSFKESLARGKNGEAKLLKLWPDLKLLDGYTHDFCLQSTGQHLELKTDSWAMEKTPNFFIEIWSDFEKQKPGGPWQARKNKTELWAYLYTQNDVLFVFETGPLAAWVDANWKSYTPVNIFNRSWITVGIKVQRVDLEHLYTKKDLKGGI